MNRRANEDRQVALVTGASSGIGAAIASRLLAGADKGTASPPTVVADSVWQAVTARRPKTRYLMDGGAKLLVGLRWLLSDRAFDRVMKMAAARMARAA
jgi:NAD(P)-dependent dehydrogenase (short-subunit alcohol dehydrogenase family)